MNDKREFTGVWIPKHIIEDKKLKPVDRLIYAEISCFEVCTMTNKTLADRAGCSEDTASRSIGRLKEKGYIKIIGFNGRVRKMQSFHIKPPQNAEAASAKTPKLPPQNKAQDNNIDNNQNTNNKDMSNNIDELKFIHSEICKLFNKSESRYKLSDKRKQKLKSRLKDLGKEGILQACEAITRSEFHMGENQRNWIAEPYWVLENFERAEKWSGEYQNNNKYADLTKLEF